MKVLSLTKKKEFNTLFSKGKRVFKPHLTVVYFVLNNNVDIGNLKIAYVVSKKISSKAVVRNKIKRRMRASIRKILTSMGNQKNVVSAKIVLFAILPSKKIVDIPFDQLCLELEQSMKKMMNFL